MAPAYGTNVERATRSAHPDVRRVDFADLKDAIVKGVADFNAMPTHYFYLAIIYPIVTFSIVAFYGDLDLLPLIFPLLAGYTIIGPLIATGTYELSRRREFGRYTSRANAFLVFKSHSIHAITILGIFLMMIYFAWLFLARVIYEQHFGTVAPESYSAFVSQLLTPDGLSLIVIGSVIGGAFAVIVLSISVVSFPMLLDQDVGIIISVRTSVKAVITNPLIMAAWGLIVAVSLLAGTLVAFAGLSVVLPVLGHSTWHLYRKMVES